MGDGSITGIEVVLALNKLNTWPLVNKEMLRTFPPSMTMRNAKQQQCRPAGPKGGCTLKEKRVEKRRRGGSEEHVHESEESSKEEKRRKRILMAKSPLSIVDWTRSKRDSTTRSATKLPPRPLFVPDGKHLGVM